MRTGESGEMEGEEVWKGWSDDGDVMFMIHRKVIVISMQSVMSHE